MLQKHEVIDRITDLLPLAKANDLVYIYNNLSPFDELYIDQNGNIEVVGEEDEE